MTKIIIKEVILDYFKGVRNLHLLFDGNTTRIYGENGSGKTTIMDAFLWLLFNKNSAGDAKFAIKTLDSKGAVIPNVQHRVQFTLDITKDDTTETRIFEKRFIEKRVTRRGRLTDEIENTTEYYIDGESYSKTEYDIKVRNIVDEETFRSVTSPMYFNSLHWKDQRSFLERLANADYSSVENDKRFSDITSRNQFGSVEEYLKHLSTNIKLCKEKIDDIPNKIEGINMVRPEAQDWDKLQADLSASEKELTELNATRSALANGNNNAKFTAIRNKIEFCNRRIDEMRKGARNLANQYANEYDNQKRALANKLYEEQAKLKQIEQKRNSLSQLVARLQDNIQSFTLRKAELQAEYASLKKEYIDHQSVTPVCPVCGREYEDEQMIASANAQWLSLWQGKVDKVKSENKSINEQMTSAQAQIASYNQEADSIVVTDNTKALEEEAKALKAPKSYEEILLDNASYVECTKELSALQAELDGEVATDNAEVIRGLEEQIATKTAEVQSLRQSLAKKPVYDDCLAKVKALEEERDILARQLDELSERKDLADEYQQERDRILEDSVNSHFRFTRFRLFESLNDGTRKPNCVATCNGVAYSDLNSAMKINCGLDILNAISRYYGVYAPCFVDNAETVINVEPISAQQILLYVSEGTPTPTVR